MQKKVKKLLVLTAAALVVTMGPTIAYKMKVPIAIMKYLTTIALAALVALMATDYTIGIYMTYALAMVFSIFYYDKKFTLKIAIISYLLLVASLFFRSLSIPQIEFTTNFEWFFSRSLGFLLEAVVMGIICVKIADVSHKVLVEFADTLSQANLIVQESALQKDVTKEVENSFHHVNDVSNSLLEISR